MAGNFGGKIFWWIAENMSFGGIYFGAGILTGPWVSFGSVRTKLMMKCNWTLNKPLLRLLWIIFVLSVFAGPRAHRLARLPCLDRQANSSSTSGVQNSLEKWCPRTQLSIVNSMPTIRLARLAAGLIYIYIYIYNIIYIHWYDFAIIMTSHVQLFGGWNIGGLLSKPPICQNKFPAKISGYTVDIKSCT